MCDLVTGSGLKKYLFSIFLFSLAVPAQALTPGDPLFSQQWYLTQIGAPQAWDKTTGSTDVVVAVLDTGFDMDHPDLVRNVWHNGDEIEGDGIDNDDNGFVDDVHGWDFVDDDAQPLPDKTKPFDEDAIPHGSIIAGVIGATATNGEGIVGINWNVRLMNVRILNNQGTGNSGAATDAITYAVENGADVINLSFTGFEIDDRFKAALRRAFETGVVVVAAVGNAPEGINVDEKPIYPACHGENEEEDWVIGVASSDKTDTKSVFSNYGALCTDVAAPGEDIVSTGYHDTSWTPFAMSKYLGGLSGTSMAVPMVAGAAALLKAAYPSITPEQVETVLRLSADPIKATGDAVGKVGAGRLNIARALELAPQFVSSLTPAFMITEATPGSLIKLVCAGETLPDDPCRAVYFYGSDGKRHAFPNEKVYFSWYDDFASVVTVSKSSMSSLSLGKNVTYHPGKKMVKFESVPTVYAVSRKGTLRAIASETVATELYGSDWHQKIDDISDAFFGNYTFGEKILSASDYNVAAEQASVTSLDQNI